MPAQLHDSLRAAQGIKIAATGLEEAIAGSALMVCREGDDLDEIKDEIIGDLDEILNKVDRRNRGVYVQASTLGSLEALLEFLRESKIPVSGCDTCTGTDCHCTSMAQCLLLVNHNEA